MEYGAFLSNLKTKQSAPKRPTTDTDNETEPKKKSIYVRKFLPKWKIGRAWLKYEDKRGMWCHICETYYTKIKHLVSNKTMIDGRESFKVETLKYHEESRAHQFAVDIQFVC